MRAGFRKISKVDSSTVQEQKTQSQSVPPSNASDVQQPKNISPKVVSGKKRSKPSSQEEPVTSKEQIEIPKKKSRSSNGGSTKPIPVEAEKVKTYYPKIPFDPSNVLRAVEENSSSLSRRKSDRHKQALTQPDPSSPSSLSPDHQLLTTTLIQQICESELNGLQNFFSDERYSSKDSLTSHLVHVLETLPQHVIENLSKDTQFQPELSSRETQQIAQLNEILQRLQDQLKELQRCKDDQSFLYQKWGALTPSEIENAISTSSSSNHPAPREAFEFQNQLDNMTKTINSLLDGLDDVEGDINIAKETQEKLFTAHRKERFSSGGLLPPSISPSVSPSNSRVTRSQTHSIPRNTKDLIKEYTK